jgi:hypothetical protein
MTAPIVHAANGACDHATVLQNSGPMMGEVFRTSEVGVRQHLVLADAVRPALREPPLADEFRVWEERKGSASSVRFANAVVPFLGDALGYPSPPRRQRSSAHAHASAALTALRDALRADHRLPPVCVEAQWFPRAVVPPLPDALAWRPWPSDAPAVLIAAIAITAIACFAPPLLLWRREPNPRQLHPGAILTVRAIGSSLGADRSTS